MESNIRTYCYVVGTLYVINHVIPYGGGVLKVLLYPRPVIWYKLSCFNGASVVILLYFFLLALWQNCGC